MNDLMLGMHHLVLCIDNFSEKSHGRTSDPEPAHWYC